MSSPIENVKKIEDKQKVFIANSEAQNTQSLANFLPNGKLFQAKNEDGSNFRKMLSVFAREIIRKENTLQHIADEYYPFTTTDLIEEWELALGIPDECFSQEGISLDQRRKQVVAKLALMEETVTKDDFIALAAFFGFRITITTGYDASVFPLILPFLLGGDDNKTLLFTMVVTFRDHPVPPGFPLTLPFILGGVADETNLIKCLFNKLKPANVNIIYRYLAT